MTHQITDRQCLRYQHERLGRMLDSHPWDDSTSTAERDRLAAISADLRTTAAAINPQEAYGPAMRIRDDHLRSAHHLREAIAAADLQRERDTLERRARNAEMEIAAIPTDDYESMYIAWMLDAIASVRAYAHLVTHHGDYAGMQAVAHRIRAAVCSTVDAARVAARDCLDETATLAGVPVWRKTYYYDGML